MNFEVTIPLLEVHQEKPTPEAILERFKIQFLEPDPELEPEPEPEVEAPVEPELDPDQPEVDDTLEPDLQQLGPGDDEEPSEQLYHEETPAFQEASTTDFHVGHLEQPEEGYVPEEALDPDFQSHMEAGEHEEFHPNVETDSEPVAEPEPEPEEQPLFSLDALGQKDEQEEQYGDANLFNFQREDEEAAAELDFGAGEAYDNGEQSEEVRIGSNEDDLAVGYDDTAFDDTAFVVDEPKDEEQPEQVVTDEPVRHETLTYNANDMFDGIQPAAAEAPAQEEEQVDYGVEPTAMMESPFHEEPTSPGAAGGEPKQALQFEAEEIERRPDRPVTVDIPGGAPAESHPLTPAEEPLVAEKPKGDDDKFSVKQATKDDKKKKKKGFFSMFRKKK